MVYTQEGVIKDSKPWTKIFAAGAAAVTLAVGMFAGVFAASTVFVTPSETQGWTTAETRANGDVNFVADLDTPLGDGALQLLTGDATGTPLQDKAQYLKSTNTMLTDLNDVSYWTKQVSASFEAGLPSFQLPVCLYGLNEAGTNCANVPETTTSSFTTLVYEPYVDQGNAAVLEDTWQQWDVDAGKLWSSKTVAGLVSTQGSTTYLLEDLKTSYPNAVVFQFGVNVGSNNPNYDTRVDGIQFNDTLYDFELTAPDVQDPTVPQNLGWTSPDLACGSTTSSNTITANWSDSTDNVGVISYNYLVKTPADASWATAWATTVPTSQYSGAFTEGEGVYTYRVSAVDAAGNVSEWSSDCAVTYDTTPKVLSAQDCKNGGYKNVYTANDKEFKNQGSCVAYANANVNASFKRNDQ